MMSDQTLAQSETKREQEAKTRNLRQRILTGVIATPPVLLCAILGGWVFTVFVLLLLLIGGLEFYRLAGGRAIQGSAAVGIATAAGVILAFTLESPRQWAAVAGIAVAGTLASLLLGVLRHQDARRSLLQTLTLLAGVLYLGFPGGFVVEIRQQPEGLFWLLLALTGALGTDTFAYIGGRLWGRLRLAPAVSPSKTVEGALTGGTVGFLLMLLLLWGSNHLTPATVLLAAATPFVATLGDLLESAIKRFFKVKDSHLDGLDILPGHGGILDRVDSSLLVVTVFYFFLLAMGIIR
ncbi:MAG: phosphatidate cytidylyltransferase [Chloroflexi bacterium]|nr:phosphatidate cytidylyltransferase [Chloroflexota bacterium]